MKTLVLRSILAWACSFAVWGIGISQTTIINPAGDGGFETGTTFAANGWAVVNGTPSNRWVCNNGATAGFSGARCAYITNFDTLAPPPHSYTTSQSATVHLYRDVTFPAGETNISFSFSIRMTGETGWDRLLVYISTGAPSGTPTAGTPASSSTTLSGYTLLSTQTQAASWTNRTVPITAAQAGNSMAASTRRILFVWQNDSSAGSNPPAAIDNISLSSAPPPPPPANDECSNAIVLTPSTMCTPVAGTTLNATQSIPAITCGSFTGTANDDVWYSFVATNTAHTVTVAGGTGFDAVVDVRSGACNGANIFCADATASGGTETVNLSGLTIGATYLIRVYEFGSGAGGTFTICVTTPAPPPTCPGGLGAGTVNIASLPYTGVGLTNCGNGNNITSANATVCGSSLYYGGEDRTFIFTPAASGLYDIIFTTTSTWSGLMLYAGCPFLGQGGSCVANAQSSSGNKTLNVNLTAGTTYYLVVDAFPSPTCHPSFDLSIASAIPPCSAPGTPVTSNIASTSATVNWAAAPGALTYDWTAGTGSSCPNGVVTNTAGTSVNLSGLAPNTTYTFCVRTSTCGSGGGASGYVSTTFTTAPLPNDNCSGAVTVSCNSTVSGSTVGATSDAGVGSCGIGTGGTPGNGVWYRLAGDGSQVTLNLCNSSYDTKVHVYSGSCGALTCVASNDDSGVCSSALRSYVVFNTTPGLDYYILVNGYESATGAFSMSISCACGVPLGAPWTVSSIGGAVGQAIDNVCGGSIDISSNGFEPSASSDKMLFASQTLCGNQTITVKINSITNNGSAGIMFRENNDPGSKLVALRTNLSNFLYRDIRSTTDGNKTSQPLLAFTHSWLRLERTGNLIIGYRSTNGVTWTQSLIASVPMNSCVEVGMFVYGNTVNSTATAFFSNVSISTGTIAPVVDSGSNDFSAVAGAEFSLFPNPAQSEINIKMSESFLGKEVTIQVSNQLGQAVMVRRIGEVQTLVENLQISELPHGVYIMTLRSEGHETLSRKFVAGAVRP